MADDKGNWTVPVDDSVEPGKEVEATATDGSGNTSDPVTEKVPEAKDTTPPAVSIDPIPEDATAITGTTEPGATVTVTYPDGDTATTVADGSGNWTVPVDDSVKPGKEVTAVATDGAGNTSQPAVEPVNGITVNPLSGDNFIDGSSDHVPGGLIPVTGTAYGAQEGDVVTLTVNGKEFTGTVDAAGNYSIDVPLADLAGDYKNGDAKVDAQFTQEGHTFEGQSDAYKMSVASASITPNTTDSDAKGTVVVTPHDNNDAMIISYYSEDNATAGTEHGQEAGATTGDLETLTVRKGADGQWQPEGATVEELAGKGIIVNTDTGMVTFKPNAILGGTTIAVISETNGLNSLPNENNGPNGREASVPVDKPAQDKWYTVSASEITDNVTTPDGISLANLAAKSSPQNPFKGKNGDVLISGDSTHTEELHVEFTDKDGNDQSLTLKKMSTVGRPNELAEYKCGWAVVNEDGTVNVELTQKYFKAAESNNLESARMILNGENLNDGQEVAVWASNGLGIDKPANGADWDTYQPVTADKRIDAPDVQAIDNGAATVKPGDDNTTLTVTATDEKGETHTSTLEKQNGSWVCEDFWDKGLGGENANTDDNNLWVDLVKELNEKGEFTIPGQYLQDGSTVTAEGTNADKLSATDSDTVGVNAAVTAITGIAGDDFEVNEKDINDGKGKVTITGTTKGTTGGETVTLTVDGKEIGTATVNADGTFSAEVNAGDLTNVSDADRKVTATVGDGFSRKDYTVEANETKLDSKHDVIYVNISNTLSGDSHVVGTVLDDVWVLTPKGTTMGGKYGVQYHGTLLDTGDGNDSITILDVNEWSGVLGFITGPSPVTGSDYIRVNMGAGADVLTVEGKLTDSGSLGTLSAVRNKSISNSQVDMGEGDDVVNLGNGIAYDKDVFSETYIDGGAGYDTLNITGGGVTQSMATVHPRTGATTDTNFIKGFEVIDLGDSGNSLTNVTWTAIQNNNAEQALRILSDGGMGSDASVGLDSTWKQVSTETADGVTYDVYRSTSNTAGNDHLDIWIQQGIDII